MSATMQRREGRGPRTVDFTDSAWPLSGITIEHVKSKGLIRVQGWYDVYVGIEPVEVPLEEFLSALGITS